MQKIFRRAWRIKRKMWYQDTMDNRSIRSLKKFKNSRKLYKYYNSQFLELSFFISSVASKLDPKDLSNGEDWVSSIACEFFVKLRGLSYFIWMETNCILHLMNQCEYKSDWTWSSIYGFNIVKIYITPSMDCVETRVGTYRWKCGENNSRESQRGIFS